MHSATLHDRFFRGLHLPHVQLDELRTRLRSRAHALWLWVAIDPISKLIPVLHHPEGTRHTDPGRRPCRDPRPAPAFVERVNLTIRQSVAALARRSWSTLQDAPQLFLHLGWWRAYYHFVRPHESLGVQLGQPIDRGGKRQPQRYWQRTPAMAAGLTSRRWTVRDVLALPLPPAPMGTG